MLSLVAVATMDTLFSVVSACVVLTACAPSADSAAASRGSSPAALTSATQQVDFDLPLQTTVGTLVCPLSAAMDPRESHGLQAAMRSRLSVFGRREEAQKAGCDEWRAGLPIQIDASEIERAKQMQANRKCGMLSMQTVYVFSCDLANVPGVVEAARRASAADMATGTTERDQPTTITPSAQSSSAAIAAEPSQESSAAMNDAPMEAAAKTSASAVEAAPSSGQDGTGEESR